MTGAECWYNVEYRCDKCYSFAGGLTLADSERKVTDHCIACEAPIFEYNEAPDSSLHENG